MTARTEMIGETYFLYNHCSWRRTTRDSVIVKAPQGKDVRSNPSNSAEPG